MFADNRNCGAMTGTDALAVLAANGNNGYGNGCGMGGWGYDMWWVIILFLIWGNNGWGNNNGNNAVPYVLNNGTDATIQRGFDQQAIISGLGDLGNAVNSGFSQAALGRCQDNANILAAIANLGQIFQSCCCDQKAATADLKYTVAQESCATRQETANQTTTILQAMSAGFQSLKDEFCNDRLAEAQRENANLQRQLSDANFAASQVAQSARSDAMLAQAVTELKQYLNPPAIPAYSVPNPNGCGCRNYNSCGNWNSCGY